MVRHVAEICHLKGCFGFRPRRPPTLEIHTHASAAHIVQDGVPAIVWLDKHAEAIMLTERWDDTTYTQRLPLQLEVVHLHQPFRTAPEEDVVATISFLDRDSLELFVKLGQHVLPDWLAIRQGTLGRNLLVDHGCWLVGHYGRALQLQPTAGGVTGLLQLNLHKPCVELVTHKHNQCNRIRAVSSLHMAAQLLHKESPKQRPNKDVQHMVQALQPSLPCLQRLKAQLKASAEQARGAANMRCWTEVGIMAALADCAAAALSALLKLMQQEDDTKWQPLKQAIHDAVLLRQLLRCCNTTTRPTVQEMMLRSGCFGTDEGPQSHPLTTHLDAVQFNVPVNNNPASSTAGAQPAKSVVPRLSLPGIVPVTPPVNSRSSRLGQRAAAEPQSPVRSSAGAPLARGSHSTSRLAMLQHLGHSCGENAMAADLAAFVTHKQLHASQALDGVQQKRSQLQEGTPAASVEATPAQLTPEQLCLLPVHTQLQLRALECIHLLMSQLPAEYPLPSALGCVMGQLLLASIIAKHCQALQQQEQQTAHLLDQGLQWQQHIGLQVLISCAGGGLSESCCTSCAMPEQVHSNILAQCKEQLKELCTSKRPSAQVHLACRDTLLLLRAYIRLSGQPTLVETVCSVLGHPLAQLEHMLRASRVSLWSWPAIQHMDALVQVYVQLAEQAPTQTAARHLLRILCPQQASNMPSGNCARPGGSSSGGSSAITPSTAGATLALVPAGTLQLVLELLQHSMHFTDSMPSPVAGKASHRGPIRQAGAASALGPNFAGRPSSAASQVQESDAQNQHREEKLPWVSDAATQASGPASVGPVATAAVAVKVHCWQLLEAVLKLEEQNPTTLAGAGSSTSSGSGGYESSTLECSSSTGSEWLPKRRPSATSDLPTSQWQLNSHRLSGVQHLQLADCMTSTCDVAAVLTSTAEAAVRSSDSSEQRSVSLRGVPLHLVNAISFASPSAGSAASPSSVFGITNVSASNGCEVARVLVDQLMRQRGSRPLVVQLLEETDSSQAALPMQLQILQFISAAYQGPGAYPVKVPQLSEFYVHYHFLHFTRHYYKLLTCPNLTALACCKGHVKVLLALCRHTGGTNVIRRRFLQLKVLDFVIRELSVEYNLLGRQTAFGSSSVCSTPHSSVRLPSSRYSSGAGITPCTAKQLSTTVAAVAGGLSLHHVEDALAQRGLSGLLISSVASPRTAGLTRMQPANTAEHSVQQQQPAEDGHMAADYGSSNPRHAPADAPNLTATSQDSSGHIHRLGTVLSAVQKLEAAAAGAATEPVAPMSSSSSGRRHCRPVGGRLVPAVSEKATANCSASVNPAAQSQPASGRQGRLKPRPPQVPCLGVSFAAGHAGVVEASTRAAPEEGMCVLALGVNVGSAQLTNTQVAVQAALHPHSSTASSTSTTWRPAPAKPAESTCKLGEQQPQLTGDASYDGQLIEEWEERTGLEFVFDCLSSEEQEGQHDSDCSSSDEQEDDGQHLSESMSEDETFEVRSDDSIQQCPQNRRASLLQSVPRLALGGSISLQRQCSSFSSDSACSYKPGLDLEEDFERMMSAEEAGRQGSWEFSQDGSTSDDSSLIAAGRDCLDQQQEQELQSPVASPRVNCMSAPAGNSPPTIRHRDGCSKEAHATDGDVLSSPGSDAGTRQPPLAKTLALRLSRNAVIRQQCSADPGQDVLAAACEDSTSLCDEAPGFPCLDHAAEECKEQGSAETMLQTPAAGCQLPATLSLYRRGIVPHLNLPSDQYPVPPQGLTSAVPSSARSIASAISSCSTAGRQAVPSIMAAATPLLTTRMDRHVTCSSSHGSAVGMGRHSSQCEGRHTNAEPPITMPGSIYHAHRHMHAVYADDEVHALCLELALSLLGTPTGGLDPLQLPQEPTDTSLQQKVCVLLAHLSHSDNASVLSALMERMHSHAQLTSRCPTAAPLGSGTDGSSSTPACEHAAAGSAGEVATAVRGGLAGCAHRLLKLLSPTLLDMDKVQLGGTIQQGAFSEVKTGTLWRDGALRDVAVKVLDSTENNATCFERVYNEVAILEQLQGHKGVVPLLEYGVLSNSSSSDLGGQPQWMLIFPRYSTSLRAWRHSRGHGSQQGDMRLYLRIFVQVANIVRDLHASNIVHYDIKGDNLLIDTTCSSSNGTIPFSVVLADFGDACTFDSTLSTSAQRHRGTELFSSPEMLLLHAGQHHPGHVQHDRRKHRGVGPAHDVWSLGCTLYELVTGRVLFEEEGVGRITSYAPSSCGGGASGQSRGRNSSAAGASCSGDVLRSNERAALGGHAGVIELVESMLAGDASWRPGAAEVVYKAERLLASQ